MRLKYAGILAFLLLGLTAAAARAGTAASPCDAACVAQLREAVQNADTAVAAARMQGEIALLRQRIDDLQSRIDDTNAHINDALFILEVFFSVMTVTLAVGGIFAYRNAGDRAGREAKKWLEDNKTNVLGELASDLEKEAARLRTEMSDARDRVLDHEALLHEALERVEETVSRGVAAEVSSADLETLTKATQALGEKPESQFTADDWRTRGLAAGAVKKWDEAAVYFGKILELPRATPEQIARALFHKGAALGELGHAQDELAAYDEVIRRFGDSSEPGLREQVAKALFNKGITLSQINRMDDAAEVCDDVISRFGGAPEAEIRKLVDSARALRDTLTGESAA
jgi:tetratricopeptide (TPR) repeat protein